MSKISRRTIIITLPILVVLTLSTGVARGDLDGDGNLDAVFANTNVQPNRVCLGNGTGGFISCSNVSADTNNSLGMALGFVDGDSDLDAVFANAGFPPQRNRVCRGDGAGGFTVPCSDVSADTLVSLSVALGFVDGDGNLDAIFANSLGSPNRVCLGNGTGGFISCSNVSADTNASLSLALGFVDGDATLDAVFANSGQRNRVCLGNGDGTFGAPGNECSDVSTDTNNSLGMALGFVDGDATLDAVFANNGQRNRVCLGNGDGTFGTPGNECSDVSTDTNNGRDVALGFVDADATLDAVFANTGQRNRVCLGNGDGTFGTPGNECSDVSADTNASLSLALGFVDGDATLDAVFANSGQRNRVCLGNGDGTFGAPGNECSDVSTDTNNSLGMALGLAPTTTTITADTPDPSVVGQDVTVSYTATVVSPGMGTPTGTVKVSDGTNSCTGTVAAGQCTVTLNPPGAKTLTATYTGDSDFQMSADTEPHTVNPLSSSPAAASGDDDCFIATAAFGSPLAPQVQLLREVRDQYLLPHPVGQGLVALYYTLSPPLAEMIAGSETLRAIVRAGLTPIIGWATLVLWAPSLGMGIPLVALAFGVWVALRGVRRRRRLAAGLAVPLFPDPEADYPDISDDGRER